MTFRTSIRTAALASVFSFAAFLAASFAMPAPSFAGVHYKSTSTTENAGQKPMVMNVEAWAAGDQARVEFTQSDNPFLKSGVYLLSKDAGESLILVDPKEKKFGSFSLDAILGSAGALLGGSSPLLKMEISSPKVEKLLEEDGGEVAGIPTKHFRYRTSYRMNLKVFGISRPADVVSVEDLWVADSLTEKALGVWLRSRQVKTGNADLDGLIAAEAGKYQGFPLKTVIVTTSTSAKGKPTTSTTRMEVTTVEKFTTSPVSFDVPAGYREEEMMPQFPGMP